MAVNDTSTSDQQLLKAERTELLRQVQAWLELPMQLLSFAWLALLIIELTRGLTPSMEVAGTIIWITLILDFLLRLVIAPDKSSYVRANWFTAVALVVPALRIIRAFSAIRLLRFSRFPRGLRVFRLVSSLNRGMRALGMTMRRNGFAYVFALTVIVVFSGAAGMYRFEKEMPGNPGFGTYGEALWWTAMMMTTMGSDIFPITTEGRALCLLLAMYAFAVFGYMTATVASFLIDRGKRADVSRAADPDVEKLRAEIAGLREEIRSFYRK